MVEGGSSKLFHTIKTMLYAEPLILHQLLDKLATACAYLLQAQVDAGADCVMIFDTWGGVLSLETYQQFSLAYMKKIVDAMKVTKYQHIPVILFTKNGGQWLEKIADTGCHGIGIDWTVDLQQARLRVGDRVALQGNLDPAILYAPPEILQREVKKTLQSAGSHPGYIFNLGHGINPDVSPEKLTMMIEAVRRG
jgi:uroporphyrinogen decarboxylase